MLLFLCLWPDVTNVMASKHSKKEKKLNSGCPFVAQKRLCLIKFPFYSSSLHAGYPVMDKHLTQGGSSKPHSHFMMGVLGWITCDGQVSHVGWGGGELMFSLTL